MPTNLSGQDLDKAARGVAEGAVLLGQTFGFWVVVIALIVVSCWGIAKIVSAWRGRA